MTRALLLSTYVKFINLFPEIKQRIQVREVNKTRQVERLIAGQQVLQVNWQGMTTAQAVGQYVWQVNSRKRKTNSRSKCQVVQHGVNGSRR